jgi:hypothetical protein
MSRVPLWRCRWFGRSLLSIPTQLVEIFFLPTHAKIKSNAQRKLHRKESQASAKDHEQMAGGEIFSVK